MLKIQATPEPRLLVAVEPAAHPPEPATHPEPPADMNPPATRSRRGVLIVVTVLALVAAYAGGRMWWRAHYFIETENAYATGRVHPVSARVAGVVVAVKIEDNQKVQAGDVIAELDPVDQRIRVEQIAAQIHSVEQQIAQVNAQVAQARAQSSGMTAQVAQSAALLQRAELDAARYSKLYGAQMKAVSQAEVDGALAVLAAARADQMGRRHAVDAAQAQVAVALSARDISKAQIDVLQVQLKEAQQQLAYNRIATLVAGTVGKRSVEVGMRVQPGQQLAAIVQDDVWVTANFKETQLGGLHPGQEATVTFDAIPDRPLVGRIESFSPASGAQFALLPADNATGNFTKIVQRVAVKIVLRQDDAKAMRGALVPGMSALVEVRRDRS